MLHWAVLPNVVAVGAFSDVDIFRLLLAGVFDGLSSPSSFRLLLVVAPCLFSSLAARLVLAGVLLFAGVVPGGVPVISGVEKSLCFLSL